MTDISQGFDVLSFIANTLKVVGLYSVSYTEFLIWQKVGRSDAHKSLYIGGAGLQML